MNELTTDVKTHVIITHSGSHYFITAMQNLGLGAVGLGDFFELEGNKIKGSSIAEVMTTQQYYDTFPNKHPGLGAGRGNEFEKYEQEERLKQVSGNIVDRTGAKGLGQLMKGLKRFIDEHHTKTGKIPTKAIALYEGMEKKLKNIQNANPEAAAHS